MPPPRLPDYSHLAPKMSGSDRLDVAVAAVARAGVRARPEAVLGKDTVLAEGDWQHWQPQMSARGMPL